MLLVILLCGFVLPAKSEANNIEIYSKSWSYHYIKAEDGQKYNQDHDNFGIKINRFAIGSFINSINRRSNYIGYVKNIDNSFHYSLILVTGYNEYKVIPIPLFGYTLKSSYIKIYNIQPAIEFNIAPSVFTSSIKFIF